VCGCPGGGAGSTSAQKSPVSDLGQSVHELSKAQPQPWPGGRREAYERFLEHERASAQAIRAGSAANPPTGPEPLMERI
jgi:hypothetical protein